MSEDRSFDLLTELRQYTRKVGTSANSALIRYYLPRLKLSIERTPSYKKIQDKK